MPGALPCSEEVELQVDDPETGFEPVQLDPPRFGQVVKYGPTVAVPSGNGQQCGALNLPDSKSGQTGLSGDEVD